MVPMSFASRRSDLPVRPGFLARPLTMIAAAALLAASGSFAALAQDGAPPAPPAGRSDELPKWEPGPRHVEVISNLDGVSGLFRLWRDKSTPDLFAELPKDIEKRLLFLAYTVSGGINEAGVQFGDQYGSFKRFGKQLAFIEPNFAVRTSGDEESKRGRDRVFTDRVLFKAPIIGIGPGGGYMVNLTDVFGKGAPTFFGGRVGGMDPSLMEVSKAKGFPRNVELSYQMPIAGGRFATIAYSIAEIPKDTGYKPRLADERVGYFTTTYQDVGQPAKEDPFVRYINRWKVEKADASLQLSPPKEPIVFYVEHTVPIRYRRYVRDGILAWNRAFEKIGIDGAIQVYQQDARTGAHMDKDPEDARYNFVLWTNGNMGYAIGPSRVHPQTGQILDADIVMDEGFVSSYARTWDLLPDFVSQGMGPDTQAWLAEHPQWDPRIRLVDPARREIAAELVAQQYQRDLQLQHALDCGHDHGPSLLGTEPGDGLTGRLSQLNGYCHNGRAKTIDLAIARLAPEIIEMALRKELAAAAQAAAAEEAANSGETEDERKKREAAAAQDGAKPDAPRTAKAARDENPNRPGYIDGLPEQFVGAMIKDVIMHECGHTLGLRHNFKGSTYRTMAELNSDNRPLVATTVMDYLPVNINTGDGPIQGHWGMSDIGPYDMWVIAYGYGPDSDLKSLLAQNTKPEYIYGTDEDTRGPDPTIRRFDHSKDPLDYAQSQMRLVAKLRPRITSDLVKDGDSWARARRLFETLLARHAQATMIAADWVGGAYTSRAKKGDPDAPPAVRPVDPATSRRALQLVTDLAFRDDSFGLNPELVQQLGVGRWMDEGGMRDIMAPPAWPVHDRILSVQSMALTRIMNPDTLARVYDNEVMTASDADAMTLPELMGTVQRAVWSELLVPPSGSFSDRNPMISSLRRNLQREWTDRTIEIMLPGGFRGPAAAPAATLARAQLNQLVTDIDASMGRSGSMDNYTKAHLAETKLRVGKALDATYTFNPARQAGAGAGGRIFLGQPTPPAVPAPAPAPSDSGSSN